MLPYLRDHGWEPTMVCVEDPSETRNRDERLAFNIPAGTEILRIRCPRAWPGFGSLGLRSYGSLRKAGEHWIGENRPDLIYLTTTEFDLFRLGPAWRRKTGVPYVLDYQDPWVTDYYERPGAPRPPGGRWKYGCSQWRGRRFEPGCVGEASGVSCVSQAYGDDLRARYPSLPRIPIREIPFGVSEVDWQLASRLGKVPWEGRIQDSQVWLNLGRLAPSMGLALEAFFYSLSHRPPPPGTVILFLGTSYVAGQVSELDPVKMAARICPQVAVQAWPGRLPILDAFRTLQRAGRLLFFGSNDPGYTPSRLYPYLLAEKPLLAILHAESPAFSKMLGSGAPGLVGFRKGETAPALGKRVAEARWNLPVQAKDRIYNAEKMTKDLCEMFDQIVGSMGGDGKLDFDED